MNSSFSKKINIAIDGYSACGKSTLAKGLAEKLGYLYIDSGAMYRAATLFALKNGIIRDEKINKELLLQKLIEINVNFELFDNNNFHTFLNGCDVESEIRKIEVSSWVSEISAIPEVRHKMVALQRDLAKDKGVVMDGRDIGTVVFPDAELKLFLIADINVRAERRYNELKKQNSDVDFETVKENLIKRDRIDTTRSESPLKQADDAIVIDNSHITKEEQLENGYSIALKIIKNKNKNRFWEWIKEWFWLIDI